MKIVAKPFYMFGTFYSLSVIGSMPSRCGTCLAFCP